MACARGWPDSSQPLHEIPPVILSGMVVFPSSWNPGHRRDGSPSWFRPSGNAMVAIAVKLDQFVEKGSILTHASPSISKSQRTEIFC